jgi:hypothetical protein
MASNCFTTWHVIEGQQKIIAENVCCWLQEGRVVSRLLCLLSACAVGGNNTAVVDAAVVNTSSVKVEQISRRTLSLANQIQTIQMSWANESGTVSIRWRVARCQSGRPADSSSTASFSMETSKGKPTAAASASAACTTATTTQQRDHDVVTSRLGHRFLLLVASEFFRRPALQAETFWPRLPRLWTFSVFIRISGRNARVSSITHASMKHAPHNSLYWLTCSTSHLAEINDGPDSWFYLALLPLVINSPDLFSLKAVSCSDESAQ